MLSRLTFILYAILFMALIIKPIVVKAETVTIPVFLDYQQLQLLMVRDNFKGSNNTAKYLLDDKRLHKYNLFGTPHVNRGRAAKSGR